ncbi:hypothetical protein ACSS6W_010787 [Trichoderma asperelloides]
MLLLSILVALLSGFGLVVGLNNAQPNLDIWDIDASCIPHQSTLRKAYNDVTVMAAKALRDVQFVQQPRPSHLQDRIEWDRIARAFENMFGFKPGEEGTGPEDIYFKKVLDPIYSWWLLELGYTNRDLLPTVTPGASASAVLMFSPVLESKKTSSHFVTFSLIEYPKQNRQ